MKAKIRSILDSQIENKEEAILSLFQPLMDASVQTVTANIFSLSNGVAKLHKAINDLYNNQ